MNIVTTCEYGALNDLSKLCLAVRDGDRIVLESNRTYHVCPEDSFVLTGYYISNSALKAQNPNGTRYTALYLKGKKNITVDGNGATILVHGVMTPIILDACENVTLKNFTVDYARPTMSEMTVVSEDQGVYTVSVNPESLYEIREGILWWVGEKNGDGKFRWEHPYRGGIILSQYHDPVHHAWQYCPKGTGAPYGNVPSFAEVKEVAPNLLSVTLEDPAQSMPVGWVVQTRNPVRDQVGSFFQRCKNLTLKDLRIAYMHGLGLISQFCENVTFDGLNCLPKEGRTFASSADFFHFSGCGGDVTIERCQAAGAHDDFVNAHGTYLRVIEADPKDKTVLVRFSNGQSWGFEAFVPNDRVLFTCWEHFEAIRENTVEWVERINDTDIRLGLKESLPSIELEKDVLENLTWRPRIVVRSNYFGPSSGRGILCSTGGTAIIEDNVYDHVSWGMLIGETDCRHWFESGRPDHVIIRRNKIIHCGGEKRCNPPAVIWVHPKVSDHFFDGFVYSEITVEENEFIDPPFNGEYAFEFKWTKRVNILNNTFGGGFTVRQFHVGELNVRNNK